MIIENCEVKVKVLSTKYEPRNRGEKNDLRKKILVKEEEDGQKAVNLEIKEEICSLS